MYSGALRPQQHTFVSTARLLSKHDELVIETLALFTAVSFRSHLDYIRLNVSHYESFYFLFLGFMFLL